MDCNNNCWPSGHWTVKEQLLGVQPLESLLQHTLWSCQLSGKDNCTASSHQSITAQSFLSESKADGYNKASEHEKSVMIVRFFYLSLKSRSFFDKMTRVLSPLYSGLQRLLPGEKHMHLLPVMDFFLYHIWHYMQNIKSRQKLWSLDISEHIFFKTWHLFLISTVIFFC